MQIDKDIPLPEETRGRKLKIGSIRDTLQKMEVLESFLYTKTRSSIASMVSTYGGDRKFATRIVEGGVRVWRIK